MMFSYKRIYLRARKNDENIPDMPQFAPCRCHGLNTFARVLSPTPILFSRALRALKRTIQKQKIFHSWDQATDSDNIGNVLETALVFVIVFT